MSPGHYVRVLREQWLTVTGGVILGVVVAVFFMLFQRPEFASEATLYVSAQSSDTTASAGYDGQLLAQEKVKSYVEILQDPRVGDLVSARLRGDVTPQEVTDSIQAEVPPETSLIRMTVTSNSPQRAEQIADAVTRELPGLVDSLERPDPTRPPSVVVKVVRPPSTSTDTVSTGWPTALLVGALAGLIVGSGAALARGSLDRSIRTADDLRVASGAPVLGTTFHDAASASSFVDASPVAAEAYRHVRTSLAYLAVDSTNKVILFTSALPAEGKSTALCNIATALGQKEQRVLLVDADLRRPAIARLLRLDTDVGVTTLLTQRATVEQCIRTAPEGSFDVLPSGPTPPNPSELVASRRMGALLADLRERYDVVLLDAPPVLPVADAAELATYADGIVVVCQFGRTTSRTIAQAVSLLRVASTPLVGSILTMAPKKTSVFAYESVAPTVSSGRRSRVAATVGRRPSPASGPGSLPSSRGDLLDETPGADQTVAQPSPR